VDPVQGFDVSVMVIGSDGPDLVGEYQEVEFSVKNDTEEYLELNERVARILDGEIKIEGKLKRGWTSMDILSKTFGVSTIRRGERVPASPRFVIAFSVNAPEKGLTGRYKCEQAVIPELTISIASGKGVVKKDMSFKAEGISAA